MRKETVPPKAHLLLSSHVFVSCLNIVCCHNETTRQLSESECTNRKKTLEDRGNLEDAQQSFLCLLRKIQEHNVFIPKCFYRAIPGEKLPYYSVTRKYFLELAQNERF